MDALEAVGDPELRETLLVARRQSSAITADELAAAQGIHRNVARSRLERLAAAGLLEVAFERRTGRSGPGAGRPAKTYSVAPEVKAIEFPARGYETLLAHLLEAMPSKAMRAAGEAFGGDLARRAGLKRRRSVRAGSDAVCDAFRSLGFHATVESTVGGEATIVTATCPLRPLVLSNPDATQIDAGMWAGLAAAATGRAPSAVACEHHGCLDDDRPCTVRLRFARV